LIEPDVDITNWKLSINNDTFIPFDLSGTQVLQENIKRLPTAKQQLNFLNDTAVTWLSDIYGRGAAWMGPIGGTAKGGVSTRIGEQIVAYMTTGDSGSLFINREGYAPHSFLEYRFGDGVLVEDYLKIGGVNSLRLKATDSAAGGAYTVVTNQLRR
jgi:hypothetical protein